MNYKETLEFLYSQLPAYHRIGIAAYKNNLNNSIALDNYLGNPHRNYLTIHIAGTNGKGSVSHMLASVLQEAGYLTGLYTSPHLKDFRERIKVNGEMIHESDVVEFVKKHSEIIKSLEPSFFEMTVAMAFDYFAKCGIDVAVVEAGLGGRLDSTNIINPVLSIITNIGHDHMALLGDTLGKVAIEKAGIMKEKIPVVIGESIPETKEIFIARSTDLSCPVTFADERYASSFEDETSMDVYRRYQVTDTITNTLTKGEISLGGDYQLKNLATLFSAIDKLKEVFKLSDLNISEGIKKVVLNTGLLGRWQILSQVPLTICDTGHNLEGLKYVMEQLGKIKKSTLHIVAGFVNDKDLKSILPLFPPDAIYYFTKAQIPRSLNEEILKTEASNYGLHGDCFSDVQAALYKARRNALPSDVIFIGGSNFIVAEVI